MNAQPKTIIQRMLEGEILALAEYRSSTAATGTVTNDDDKKEATAYIRYQTECGGKAMEITEPIKDKDAIAKFNAEAWNAAPRKFRKGEIVLVVLASKSWRNGWHCKGKLESLPADLDGPVKAALAKMQPI